MPTQPCAVDFEDLQVIVHFVSVCLNARRAVDIKGLYTVGKKPYRLQKVCDVEEPQPATEQIAE